METPTRSACIFRFGQFEADSVRNTLLRNGARIKMQDQPFDPSLFMEAAAGHRRQ
jgi:hypothetical protein